MCARVCLIPDFPRLFAGVVSELARATEEAPAGSGAARGCAAQPGVLWHGPLPLLPQLAHTQRILYLVSKYQFVHYLLWSVFNTQ